MSRSPLPTPSNERERQVVEFFAAWGRSFDELCASYALLAEEGIWDQRPFPRFRGPEKSVRFLRFSRATLGLDTIAVEILRITSTGDTVLVERIDRLRRADGTLIASAPLVGVLEFRDGQIIYWREYFDSAEFAARALVLSARAAVRGLLGHTIGAVLSGARRPGTRPGQPRRRPGA